MENPYILQSESVTEKRRVVREKQEGSSREGGGQEGAAPGEGGWRKAEEVEGGEGGEVGEGEEVEGGEGGEVEANGENPALPL